MPTSVTRAVAAVSRIAAGQWGLLTTAQAEREGVTRLRLARLTDAGVLERVAHGIYATAPSPHEHRTLRAAWLALDPARTAEERLADLTSAGVASHTSAAALHRLGDLLDDQPEITLPHRKQSRRGIRLHRGALSDQDVTLVDGMPTTTEARTAVDLLRDGHDPEHVAAVIGQGVRRGVIDLDELADRIDPLARRHGHPDGHSLVEHLLDLVDLSPTALARDLLDTRAGQQLVAAGRASALSDLYASLMPQIDTARLLGPDMLASLQTEIAKHLDVPDPRATLGSLNTPAIRAAIEAARPATKAVAQWIASEEGRNVTRSAADAQATYAKDVR